MEETSWFSSTWAFTVAYFGSVAGLILFFHTVFQNFDDGLDLTKKTILAGKLTRLQKAKPGEWVFDFTQIFDNYFGKKHLSWRCFFRSTLVSITTVTLLTLLLGKKEEIFFIIPILFFLNIIIDYISLLQTRIILRKSIPLWSKIVLDYLLTCSIIYIVFLCVTLTPLVLFQFIEIKWSMLANSFSSTTAIKLIAVFLPPLLFFVNDTIQSSLGKLVIILYATTFTTSIWLWLHGISQLTIKTLSGTARFSKWLNVKDKPVQSIATVMNLYILLFSIILYFILLATR